MAKGKLAVKVFGKNETMPIAGAKVRVSSSKNGYTHTAITDLNGNIETLENLETPSPGMPYAVYTVHVEAEGYQTTIIHGVQVFPYDSRANNYAMQHTSLSRKAASSSALYNLAPHPRDESHEVPPHALVSPYHEQEEQQEQQPLSRTDKAFPVVRIPPDITVHMGKWNHSAPNVKLPTIDYLRKVASAEVDPRAHVHALRANIAAIMSFTLNRIYTDFYRGKGKEFDITSVPGMDHAFNPNQTLQSNVVDIVDDMYGVYIKNTGKQHPILTQYYNIKKVGYYMPHRVEQLELNARAKTVASYTELLEYFLGRKYGPLEIPLPVAEVGPFHTFPGEDMLCGSSGSDVTLIQTRLNVISTMYPAISKIEVSGTFDESTEKAVKTFQKKVLGVPDTGIVDRKLWYRIGYYYWSYENRMQSPAPIVRMGCRSNNRMKEWEI